MLFQGDGRLYVFDYFYFYFFFNPSAHKAVGARLALFILIQCLIHINYSMLAILTIYSNASEFQSSLVWALY